MNSIFRRTIALPTDHGSWVFILSPLIIGLFAGRVFKPASAYLTAAILAAFLLRQPVTMAVKVYSGRRPRSDLPSAWFWIGLYGIIAAVALIGLIAQGYAYLLLLVIPGGPVFAWHLLLVSRREERRQMAVEIIASGVLALAAPAAYWVGKGNPDVYGWALFGLIWLQSAASLVYTYLRLEQRQLKSIPDIPTRLVMARRSLLYSTFNLVIAGLLCVLKLLPAWIWLPYALQEAETVWGTFPPVVGVRPARIGFRQLAISILFTLLFILTWTF